MRRLAFGALVALTIGTSAPPRLLAQDTPRVATMATLDWVWQRPELLRYNRVEGLSLGARGAVRFGLGGGPLTAALTARLGTADREPRVTVSLGREGVSHAIALSAYRDLQPVDQAGGFFGLGNSVAALVFGRDDGDYFQAGGAALTWTPPSAHRAWYRVRIFAERQEPVAGASPVSLFHWWGWVDGFRAATLAARADQAGFEAMVSPWWGKDPNRPAVGWELSLHGERGDFDFVRARMGLRAVVPMPARARLDLSARAGGTKGDAPPQRLWILGGPNSLRGFAPGMASGPVFLSGRAELTRPLWELPWLRAVDLTLFADGGGAGERDQLGWASAMASVGGGISIVDGFLRLEAGRSWKGPDSHRVDLYIRGQR